VLRTPAGGAGVLALADRTGSVDLGLGRPLHLDPARILATIGGLLGPERRILLPIPMEPALLDVAVFAQAAVLLPGGGARLTSSVEFWIGR
jgi:hypothetical protein